MQTIKDDFVNPEIDFRSAEHGVVVIHSERYGDKKTHTYTFKNSSEVERDRGFSDIRVHDGYGNDFGMRFEDKQEANDIFHKLVVAKNRCKVEQDQKVKAAHVTVADRIANQLDTQTRRANAARSRRPKP